MAADLQVHKGVRVGDTVRVLGWNRPGSIDYRIVKRMWRHKGYAGGVVVELDKPLKNGSTRISFTWLLEAGL